MESDFSPTKVRWEAFGLERQAPRSLEATLNDVALSLATRDSAQRNNNAERTPDIEVILEIGEMSRIVGPPSITKLPDASVPPFLGESVQEDITGNFAR